MRSQNRMRMSLKSNRRIGALNSRRLRQKFHCSVTAFFANGSSRSCLCTRIVAAESKIEMMRAMRTPGTTPKRSINMPPKIGAIIIGRRLIIICIPTPIERRFAARVAPTRENVAGSEKHVHERKRNIPAMTAPQCGINSTRA